MSPHADDNWWDFSIDSKIRSNPKKATIRGEDRVEVNPADGERRRLEYHSYLKLNKLLRSQTPSSRIPDERVFIITHQLFELAFKLMIFDLAVLAKTFQKLLRIEARDSRGFLQLCKARAHRHEDFWRPALTASARLKFSAAGLLPTFMRLLGKGDDETFNSIEFYFFRDNLIPASGFQTAQFRLIQKALGKTNLLAVRLFPSDTFSRNYKGKINGPVRVTDQIILRRGAEVATPPEGSRLAMIAVLDELAHALLAKLPPYEPKPSPMASIRDYEVKRASNILDNLLEHKRHEDRRREIKFSESARAKSDANILELFNRDLTEAMNRENQRREGFSRARLGALYLRKKAKGSHLATVFDRLVAADNNLFGTHDTSFLTVHSRVAISRIDDATDYARRIGKPEPPSGTGGGGKHYLGYSRSSLIPLFKALIAYRGL